MSRVVLLRALIVGFVLTGCRSQSVHHETIYHSSPATASVESEESELAETLPVPGNPPQRVARKEPPRSEPQTWRERHQVSCKVSSWIGTAMATTAVIALVLGGGLLFAAAAGNAAAQTSR